MSNTTKPMAEVNLGPTFGPIFIGALVEAALWGMTTVQTIVYFINYGSKDRWGLKTVVLINFCLTSGLVIAITSAVYSALVLHFGNLTLLKLFPWGIRAGGLLSSLTICIIQSFFLVRVYRFSQSIWPLVLGTPFVVATLGLALVSDVQVLINPSRDTKFGHVNVACQAVMAATDILLAGLVTFYLKRREPEMTRITPTGVVIENIIKYTIGTGALTGLLALAGVIMPFVGASTIAIAFTAATPHTYSNAMLITLNTRKLVAKPWNTNVVLANEISGVQFNGRATWEDSTFHSQTKTGHHIETGTGTLPGSVEPKIILKPESSVGTE